METRPRHLRRRRNYLLGHAGREGVRGGLSSTAGAFQFIPPSGSRCADVSWRGGTSVVKNSPPRKFLFFVCLFLSPRPEASRSASRVIHYRFQLMLPCCCRPSSRLSAEPCTCPQSSCLLLCFASPSGESVATGVFFSFFHRSAAASVTAYCRRGLRASLWMRHRVSAAVKDAGHAFIRQVFLPPH